MTINMKGHSLLTLKDLSQEEIRFLIDEAKEFKTNRSRFIQNQPLRGKTLGMIFQKRSTRTRVSTETAMVELGGHALFLGKDDIQLGVNESLHDTAKVLGRMVSGILARVFDHTDVKILAKHSGIPVINALSDLFHPLQGLADIMTIEEHLGKLKGVNIAWIGDGNNVCHSLMVASIKMGMNICIATPEKYEPDPTILEYCIKNALSSEQVKMTHDPIMAAKGANVVVTDTFISMGQESEKQEKLRKFKAFQVNSQLVQHADKDFIFMHCLPRHKEEVTDEIIYGEHSVVFDEAENRLHTVAAVLKNFL
ncbi:MAG: ornithine carbamoyltransferase [Candidatus Heimdallarchaeota archaeon]|nr:MAG: ornithine carbamoyltransferase [Candidatus Heimdallarchaeota archaeon]